MTTKPKGLVILSNRGQPKEILKRMRPAFREHVRPHTKNQEGERLGGGNVLSMLWEHRETRDIDAYVKLATTESGNTILDTAAAACGAYRVDHPAFKRLEFERNRDNHIDVTFQTPIPGTGERSVLVDGEPTTILSTAQIMSGKLQGRGMTAPVRDLYDIGVCRLADPEALEIAVNSVPDEKLNAILTIYQNLKTQYEQDVEKLTETPEELKPIRENPTGYAHNAIVQSRYSKLEITTRDGIAEVEIQSSQDRRAQTYDTAEALLEGLEANGVNAFLTAQDRDAQSILHATIDAMWTQTNTTIVDIRPEALKHAPLELPPLHWTPPVLRTERPTTAAEDRDETELALEPPSATLLTDDPTPTPGTDDDQLGSVSSGTHQHESTPADPERTGPGPKIR